MRPRLSQTRLRFLGAPVSRRSQYVSLAAAAVFVAACAGEPTSPTSLAPTAPAFSTSTSGDLLVTVAGYDGSLAVSASDTLRATIKDASGRTWTCTSCVWRSSDTTVLAIKSWKNSAGSALATITAKKAGTATISATTQSNSVGELTITTTDLSATTTDLSAAAVTPAQWWAGLTALQRGQAIEAEAHRWVSASSSTLSDTYRCNCKEFARYAVKNATRGLVYLPPTVDTNGALNWRGWQLAPDSHVMKVTDYLSGTIDRAMIGDVVQANTNTGYPHTMIISAVTSDGVTVVDANWQQCQILRHTFTYSFFKYKFVKWSLYRVI
jgi:hypothetical protein